MAGRVDSPEPDSVYCTLSSTPVTSPTQSHLRSVFIPQQQQQQQQQQQYYQQLQTAHRPSVPPLSASQPLLQPPPLPLPPMPSQGYQPTQQPFSNPLPADMAQHVVRNIPLEHIQPSTVNTFYVQQAPSLPGPYPQQFQYMSSTTVNAMSSQQYPLINPNQYQYMASIPAPEHATSYTHVQYQPQLQQQLQQQQPQTQPQTQQSQLQQSQLQQPIQNNILVDRTYTSRMVHTEHFLASSYPQTSTTTTSGQLNQATLAAQVYPTRHNSLQYTSTQQRQQRYQPQPEHEQLFVFDSQQNYTHLHDSGFMDHVPATPPPTYGQAMSSWQPTPFQQQQQQYHLGPSNMTGLFIRDRPLAIPTETTRAIAAVIGANNQAKRQEPSQPQSVPVATRNVTPPPPQPPQPPQPPHPPLVPPPPPAAVATTAVRREEHPAAQPVSPPRQARVAETPALSARQQQPQQQQRTESQEQTREPRHASQPEQQSQSRPQERRRTRPPVRSAADILMGIQYGEFDLALAHRVVSPVNLIRGPSTAMVSDLKRQRSSEYYKLSREPAQNVNDWYRPPAYLDKDRFPACTFCFTYFIQPNTSNQRLAAQHCSMCGYIFCRNCTDYKQALGSNAAYLSQVCCTCNRLLLLVSSWSSPRNHKMRKKKKKSHEDQSRLEKVQSAFQAAFRDPNPKLSYHEFLYYRLVSLPLPEDIFRLAGISYDSRVQTPSPYLDLADMGARNVAVAKVVALIFQFQPDPNLSIRLPSSDLKIDASYQELQLISVQRELDTFQPEDRLHLAELIACEEVEQAAGVNCRETMMSDVIIQQAAERAGRKLILSLLRYPTAALSAFASKWMMTAQADMTATTTTESAALSPPSSARTLSDELGLDTNMCHLCGLRNTGDGFMVFYPCCHFACKSCAKRIPKCIECKHKAKIEYIREWPFSSLIVEKAHDPAQVASAETFSRRKQRYGLFNNTN